MAIFRDGVKIKKKQFDFPMPEFLEYAIDNFVKANNSDDSLTDCYLCELYNDINNCMHGDMTDEQLDEIRDYYIRGGMYNDDDDIE